MDNHISELENGRKNKEGCCVSLFHFQTIFYNKGWRSRGQEEKSSSREGRRLELRRTPEQINQQKTAFFLRLFGNRIAVSLTHA